MFQFWLNTFFVRCGAGEGLSDVVRALVPHRDPGDNDLAGVKPVDRVYSLTFEQEELDKANKDKKHYPEYFRLQLLWSPLIGDDEDVEKMQQDLMDHSGIEAPAGPVAGNGDERMLSTSYGRDKPPRQIPPSPRNDSIPTVTEEEDDNFNYSDTDDEEDEWGQTSKV